MEDANRWYFTKEQLANSPSRRSGIDGTRELHYRQQAAHLLQDMGQRLHMSQLCINTAIVYMHRFYVFHSFVDVHRNNLSLSGLFLAAKVEEQPRKLEHVIKVAHACLHKDSPQMDVRSEAYLDKACEVVAHENVLLQTLGFVLAIEHPHTYVVKICQLVKAHKDLAQTSYIMATTSLHMTTMCLQYKPTIVACVCIHLACKWSSYKIEPCSEGRDWFFYVDKTVTYAMLETLTQEFIEVLERSPYRYRKKFSRDVANACREQSLSHRLKMEPSLRASCSGMMNFVSGSHNRSSSSGRNITNNVKAIANHSDKDQDNSDERESSCDSSSASFSKEQLSSLFKDSYMNSNSLDGFSGTFPRESESSSWSKTTSNSTSKGALATSARKSTSSTSKDAYSDSKAGIVPKGAYPGSASKNIPDSKAGIISKYPRSTSKSVSASRNSLPIKQDVKVETNPQMFSSKDPLNLASAIDTYPDFNSKDGTVSVKDEIEEETNSNFFNSKDPLNISSSGDPLNISSSRDPLKISSSRDPLKISSSRDPLKISSSRDPLKISSSRDPLKISSSRDPLKISSSKDLLNISSSRDSLKVSSSRDPLNISSSRDPLNISSRDSFSVKEDYSVSTSKDSLPVSIKQEIKEEANSHFVTSTVKEPPFISSKDAYSLPTSKDSLPVSIKQEREEANSHVNTSTLKEPPFISSKDAYSVSTSKDIFPIKQEIQEDSPVVFPKEENVPTEDSSLRIDYSAPPKDNSSSSLSTGAPIALKEVNPSSISKTHSSSSVSKEAKSASVEVHSGSVSKNPSSKSVSKEVHSGSDVKNPSSSSVSKEAFSSSFSKEPEKSSSEKKTDHAHKRPSPTSNHKDQNTALKMKIRKDVSSHNNGHSHSKSSTSSGHKPSSNAHVPTATAAVNHSDQLTGIKVKIRKDIISLSGVAESNSKYPPPQKGGESPKKSLKIKLPKLPMPPDYFDKSSKPSNPLKLVITKNPSGTGSYIASHRNDHKESSRKRSHSSMVEGHKNSHESHSKHAKTEHSQRSHSGDSHRHKVSRSHHQRSSTGGRIDPPLPPPLPYPHQPPPPSE